MVLVLELVLRVSQHLPLSQRADGFAFDHKLLLIMVEGAICTIK